MSNIPADINDGELVGEFVRVTLAQDVALRERDNEKYGLLYRTMKNVEHELRSRHGDARLLLVPLREHPNIQVRLQAAIATLVFDQQGSRRVLEAIKDRSEFPQAADAFGILRALDRGSYVPV